MSRAPRPQLDENRPANIWWYVERRHTTRYGLKVPVGFSWKNLSGGHQWGEGITRDISTNGVFVYIDESPTVGAVIRVRIQFPSFGKRAGLEMHAEGHVLRVEPTTGIVGTIGFAFACRSFVLRNGKSAMKSGN